MTSIPGNSNRVTLGTVRTGLQFVVGLALLAYGVGQLTDAISHQLPAVVYFAAGFGLLASAVVHASQ